MGIVAKLRELLGAESANAWISFMDYVRDNLPFLISRGRPRQDDIAASEIGKAGFKSWKEMIEAPVSAGGLGWNWHSWVAWRRAYKTVQEYPYLRQLEVTASEINTMSRLAKPFPTTAEEWNGVKAELERQAQERHQRSLREAQAQVKEWQEKTLELEARLAQANDTIRQMEWIRAKEREQLQDQIANLENRIDELEQSQKRLKADNNRLEMEKLALERRLRQWAELPWYKRIFSRP